MINRTAPQSPPSIVFTDVELQLLDHADPKVVRERKRKSCEQASREHPASREPMNATTDSKERVSIDSTAKPITHYLYAVARLGGYLSRASDPPPGNKVLWRGFNRLMDLHLGFLIGAKLVGN